MKLLFNIYLFIIQIPKSDQCWVGAHQWKGKKSEKSEEKERDQGTEGKTPNPTLGNWCTHRGWRTEQKKKKKQEWVPNPATLDHSVASYNVKGSYGEPILFNPAHREEVIINVGEEVYF